MLSQEAPVYRYFLELAYKGKFFHGWQVQPNAFTVQEALNQAFSTLLHEKINLVGAGRTDTGVHASHFVAHFDLRTPIKDKSELLFKLNRFLKTGIRIDTIREVGLDLHARFSATSRTYHYIITPERSPFLEDYSWSIPRSLNYDSICEATDSLKNYTDFTSFARLHTDNKTNNCLIADIRWEQNDDYLLFRIQADRFLRNMVRAIVGTLVDVGLGRTSLQEFQDIINAKDRSAAGQSAPAHGLFLTHVEYPQDCFMTTPRSPFYGFF